MRVSAGVGPGDLEIRVVRSSQFVALLPLETRFTSFAWLGFAPHKLYAYNYFMHDRIFTNVVYAMPAGFL